jgi:hypothetical protein
MTKGEKLVRVSFNPSANPDVEDIKKRAADCIDWCEPDQTDSAEVKRLCALAQTAFEEAAMWAVKAVTA